MYWDPFEEIERMHEEMDRLFRHSYGMPERQLLPYDGKHSQLSSASRARNPVCNVHETESAILASFELPGVNKEDIELYVHDDSIEIKVESKHEKKHEEKDKKSYAMQHFSFYRSITLPKKVQSQKAVAEYKDGVLRVEVPKKEGLENKQKRLQIK